MQPLALRGGAIAIDGAVSIEHRSDGTIVPWRLQYDRLPLFEPGVVTRAGQPSGVRLTLLSDTRHVEIAVKPLQSGEEWTWDLLIGGELARRIRQPASEAVVRFPDLPNQRGDLRRLEVYLPSQYLQVRLRGVAIDAGAQARPAPADARKRWVVYGSSITHAKEAAGPSETWPALVARRFDLHLTNLGYGGQEHLEPMVARMIRDLPADCISLCVGGNVWGLSSLSERTYRAAVIGLVLTIREKHPATPIALASFIHTPRNEGGSNAHGRNLDDYRRWSADAVDALRRTGDAHLFYVHGPELYGPEHAHLQPDGVHPDAQGQRVLAERYAAMVMPRLISPQPVSAGALS